MNRKLNEWTLSGLLLVFVAGLFALRVHAQQNTTPLADKQDFILRATNGAELAEWIMEDGHVSAIPIPPALHYLPPAEQKPGPLNGQISVPRAEFMLRTADGQILGSWSIAVGAVLDCYNAKGTLMWSLPIKAGEQMTSGH